jgi:peroxiredoxin family protein
VKDSYTVGVAGSGIVTTTDPERAARTANGLASKGHTVVVHVTTTTLAAVARPGRPPITAQKLKRWALIHTE